MCLNAIGAVVRLGVGNYDRINMLITQGAFSLGGHFKSS